MPFHSFPKFQPKLVKLKKIIGTPATNIKKWCHEKTKKKTINPVTKKKKTIKDKILKLPSLAILLEELVTKVNEIIDQLDFIKDLEKRLYEVEKGLFELGIRHDEELLQLSDREIAESIRHDKELEELREMDEILMEWDSFHLGQEYDPYSTVYDEPNQPIHQFDQDNYPNASNINPSMGQNFSRLIPSVTPDVFYSDQIGRRIPAINEKGGKLQKGGKAKTKPVPTKRKK